MTDRRHPNVVNIDEVQPDVIAKGSKFGCRDRVLGPQAQTAQLGCSHYEVEPGKAAFPFHWHSAMEEALYVLEGTGTMRIGDARVAVRAGDFVAFPVGPDHAHQLINTGASTLKYICISTKASAEVVGYPDSKKIGVRAGVVFDKPWARKIIAADVKNLDYYEGEDVG